MFYPVCWLLYAIVTYHCLLILIILNYPELLEISGSCLFRLLLQPCDLNVLLLHLAPSTAISHRSTIGPRRHPPSPIHGACVSRMASSWRRSSQQNGGAESTCLQPSDKGVWQVNRPKLEEGHLSSLAELGREIQSAVFHMCGKCPWSLRLDNL